MVVLAFRLFAIKKPKLLAFLIYLPLIIIQLFITFNIYKHTPKNIIFLSLTPYQHPILTFLYSKHISFSVLFLVSTKYFLLNMNDNPHQRAKKMKSHAGFFLGRWSFITGNSKVIKEAEPQFVAVA